jgi:DNA-binding NarL/FixJ family response regulator
MRPPSPASKRVRSRLRRAAGSPIRVLVADADAAARAGVRNALEAAGLEISAEANDAPAAIEAAAHSLPDIVLLDPDLGGTGMAAIEAITTRWPEIPVIAFPASPDDNEFFAALEAGASGYLVKDVDPARLPIALVRVLEGEAALPRALAAKLIREFRSRGRETRLSRVRALTNRELEVLELFRQGLTTSEIAERLFVENVTVRTHIASILKKLDVPNRQAAIHLLTREQ